MNWKEINDLIGIQTRYLLACSIVPQPTTLPRAPGSYLVYWISMMGTFQKPSNSECSTPLPERLQDALVISTGECQGQFSDRPPRCVCGSLLVMGKGKHKQYPSHFRLRNNPRVWYPAFSEAFNKVLYRPIIELSLGRSRPCLLQISHHIIKKVLCK
jgi:hypothetical protein